MLSAYILNEPLLGRRDRARPYSKEYVRRVVDAALDIFMNGLKAR